MKSYLWQCQESRVTGTELPRGCAADLQHRDPMVMDHSRAPRPSTPHTPMPTSVAPVAPAAPAAESCLLRFYCGYRWFHGFPFFPP